MSETRRHDAEAMVSEAERGWEAVMFDSVNAKKRENSPKVELQNRGERHGAYSPKRTRSRR